MTKEQDDKYATTPDVFPMKGSSGSGSDSGFTVQARYAYPEPKDFHGQILDNRWRTLHFQQSPIGVPAQARYAPWSGSMPGLMTYPAAEALRWWFIANAAHSFDHFCLETRIIKHEIKYSYSEEAVAAGPATSSLDLQRSNFAVPPAIPKANAA